MGQKYHPVSKGNIIIWIHRLLVGGFNPFEKYYSEWESSSKNGVKINFETITQTNIDDFVHKHFQIAVGQRDKYSNLHDFSHQQQFWNFTI